MTEEWTYIPDEIKKVWDKLPDGWFKREDIDIDPLVIEEMVINGLVYKKVMEYSRLGKQSTFEISYQKL
jgi:hypothetical protein